jgi:LPXTG-motif cell wall-anchored protein
MLMGGAIGLGVVYALRSAVMYGRTGNAQEIWFALAGVLVAVAAGLYLIRFRKKLRSDSKSSGKSRMVALVAFMVTALPGGAMKASADGDELMARVGLTTSLPEVNVERFPLDEPFPVPRPEIAPGRLRMVRLDGTPLVDIQPFDEHGEPIPEAFEEISEAFAARNGHTTEIHPRLVELLMVISNSFDGKPLKLISAHRVPGVGTKKTSYHVKGMAADIAIQGVKVHDLRDAALRLGAWGVGVYPSFVHVDARTDKPYTWVGSTYRRWRYVRARAAAMRRAARARQKRRMALARAARARRR